MRELVPLTNAGAATMIRSALSKCGGEAGIRAGALTSAPTAEDAAVAAVAQAANDRSRRPDSAPRLLAAV